MKILFVVKEIKMDPLGIMYLSAALKKNNHNVYISRQDIPTDVAAVKLPLIRPDFVCYSVCSGSEKYYFNLDEQLRKKFPDIKFKSIYGGPAVTFNPEIFKDKCFIKGECEFALVDLIEGRPYKELELVDVNKIPFPDRELIYQYKEMLENPIKNIMTRRGCKFACSYCFNSQWNKLHKEQIKMCGIIRLRTLSSVIAEAKELKEKWQPLKMIHIMDDGFATSIEWLKEFIPLWKQEVNLPFICNVNPKDLTDEVAKLLSQAGCAIISLANESANDENRRKILNRFNDKQLIKDAIATCNKYNIRTRLQNIIGLPVENSLQDAYETLDFNIECKPTTSWCALLQCYKGTKIFEIAREGSFAPEDGSVDEGFFGVSTLKLKDKVLIERLHKLWPLITKYPVPFRWLTPILIRIPLPFKIYQQFFMKTKKWLSERDLWKVFK